MDACAGWAGDTASPCSESRQLPSGDISSLPTQWWRELLAARPDVARWSVHFLGPQLAAPAAARAPIGAPPRLEVASPCGRRALELTFECAAYPGAGAPARWDALALFNPGFGHHALVGAWEDALRAMLRGGAPMLVTAHSERDATDRASACRMLWSAGRARSDAERSGAPSSDPRRRSAQAGGGPTVIL